MNMILLLKSDFECAPDLAVLRDARAVHIRRILAKKTGDTVRIGLLNGPLGEGTLQQISDREVSLHCVWQDQVSPRSHLSLLLAMPRPKVLKRLWAQLAALAVDRILLVNAEKVERYYWDAHVIEPASYEPLLREGLQQAGHTAEPVVSIHRSFRKAVEDELGDFKHRVMLDPHVPRNLGTLAARPLLLGIGPEGGWNAFEHDLLRANGFYATSMMPMVLRSDTACIAALALSLTQPPSFNGPVPQES